MNEKDKQIAKDSIDVLIPYIPGLNIAWGLSKALYGAGLKLRQHKALEWVEMVRDNPEIFTQEILSQEEFQDGFVYALEKYILERSKKKCKYYRKIFLGFTKSDKKQDFELERFYYALSQLNEYDIEILPRVDMRTTSSYQIFDDRQGLENVHNLVNAGILFLDPYSRFGPVESPYVYTSSFGRRFIKYLKDEN
jgi:hypothetical protein